MGDVRPQTARRVNYLSAWKRTTAVVLAALSIYVGRYLGFALFSLCFSLFLMSRYRALRRALVFQRQLSHVYVVHCPGLSEKANEISRGIGALRYSVHQCDQFNCWELLVGTAGLILVGDADCQPHDCGVANFIEAEKRTRLLESSVYGGRENIVYTPEGKRRAAFQRLKYLSVDAPHMAHQLESFCALRLDAVSQFDSFTASDTMLPLRHAWEWAMGCPCCTQKEIEKIRHRQSDLRLTYIQWLMLGAPAFRKVREGLQSYWSYLSNLTRSYIVSAVQAPAPDLTPCNLRYQCEFGDESLIANIPATGSQNATNWVVNPTFEYVEAFLIAPHLTYSMEFLKFAQGGSIASVLFERTGARSYYTVSSEEDQRLLSSFVAGEAVADPSRFMIAARIVVASDRQQLDFDDEIPLREQLSRDGYFVLPFDIIDPVQLVAMQRCNRRLRAWLAQARPQGFQDKKFFTYNDFPVGRYLNMALTAWASRMFPRVPIVQSALALNIFVNEGPGFLIHEDTSPPFDLTLDICVDHEGPSSRPIYLSTPAKGTVKLELRPGQAAMFRGAEITHWGGDLPPGCQHNVELYTWQFCQD